MMFGFKHIHIVLIAFLVALLVTFSSAVLVIKGMVSEARTERDIYWRGEIARANEQTALAKLLQVEETQRLEGALALQTEQFQQHIDDLEHANAALPDSACGLDADRVRLLRKP